MPLFTHFKAGRHGSESSGRLLLLQLVKNYLVTYKTQTLITRSHTYFCPESNQGFSHPYILQCSISFSYYPHLNISVPSDVVFRLPSRRFGGARWRIWLRHCAKSWKVAGSIPDGVIALGLTQPLREMSTRNISWGSKDGQ
jgi:hypothetical protein